MPARTCPDCGTVLSAGEVLAYSNDLVCSGCQKPLEISGFSKNLAAFAGLAAGAVVWWGASAHYSHYAGALGWVLPILYGYIALSIVAALMLALIADLRLKSLDLAPTGETASSADFTH